MILTLCDVVISNDRRHVVSLLRMPGMVPPCCVGWSRLVKEAGAWPKGEPHAAEMNESVESDALRLAVMTSDPIVLYADSSAETAALTTNGWPSSSWIVRMSYPPPGDE